MAASVPDRATIVSVVGSSPIGQPIEPRQTMGPTDVPQRERVRATEANASEAHGAGLDFSTPMPAEEADR